MENKNVQDREQPKREDLGQTEEDFKTNKTDENSSKEERTTEMKESPEKMEKGSPNDSQMNYVFLNGKIIKYV